MADNSLHVPDASPYAIDNDGRARSNSIRSQRSTHSASLPPVTENEILENAYDTRPALEGSSRPSIRIRRVSSNIGSSEQQSGQGSSVRRNRSVSDPQRGTAVPVPRLSTRESYMPDVAEETLSPTSGIAREQFPREQPSREQFPAFEETITPESSAPASQQSPPPSSSGWRGLRRTRTSIGATTEKDKGKGTQAEMEYEEDLVDLLDLVGKCCRSDAGAKLISNRPRSLNPPNPHECSKFPLHPRSRQVPQSTTNIQSHQTPYKCRRKHFVKRRRYASTTTSENGSSSSCDAEGYWSYHEHDIFTRQ